MQGMNRNIFGNSTKTKLIFAHANGFPPLCYRPLLTRLGEQYELWAVEQRPLWQTPEDPWQTVTSWEQFSDDLIDYLEAQEIDSAVGVGHSFGATIMMYAALKRPKLFSHLVLIEPVLLPQTLLDLIYSGRYEPHLFPLVAQALKRRTQWQTRDEVWNSWRGKPLFGRFSDEALWACVNGCVEDSAEGVRLRYPISWESRIYALPPADLWARLSELTIPTLALRGEVSDTIPLEAWEQWQKLRPNATSQQLTSLGHLLPMEAPELVAQAILAYLASSLC